MGSPTRTRHSICSILWFQTRALADRSIRRHDFQGLERFWRRWSPQFQHRRKRLEREGALASG
jgi:hypothetical protein